MTLVSPSGMCHPLGTFATSRPVAEPWLSWMPWAVGVSFLQDKVPIGDLGLYFPGDGHTSVASSFLTGNLCRAASCKLLASLLLLALFSRIQASTTQVVFTGFIPGDLHLHFLGLK